MRVLFDLCHPAHVHFFKHTIQRLRQEGHHCLVTARDKECTTTLLEELDIPFELLYTRRRSSWWAMSQELILRNRALCQTIADFKPDAMAAIGGTFIAHASKTTQVPALVFYDGDNALLQNLITYPFASQIYVPDCYQGWTPKHKTKRYPGFHELSYMHPNYFKADKAIAVAAGLKEGQKNYLLRLVAWQASHDKGHFGFSQSLLAKTVKTLSQAGHLIISSECPLPKALQPFLYQGSPNQLHHLMAFCDGFVGESPTMALESAIRAVPSLFVSSLNCGNIQAMTEYGLVQKVDPRSKASLTQGLKWMAQLPIQQRLDCQSRLFANTQDMPAFIYQTILASHVKEAAA